jgi:hypothetical protein
VDVFKSEHLMLFQYRAREQVDVLSVNRWLASAVPSERLKYKRKRGGNASAESVILRFEGKNHPKV